MKNIIHPKRFFFFINNRPPALCKRVPGLAVDLSGLAKGFAVDAVARFVAELKAPLLGGFDD